MRRKNFLGITIARLNLPELSSTFLQISPLSARLFFLEMIHFHESCNDVKRPKVKSYTKWEKKPLWSRAEKPLLAAKSNRWSSRMSLGRSFHLATVVSEKKKHLVLAEFLRQKSSHLHLEFGFSNVNLCSCQSLETWLALAMALGCFSWWRGKRPWARFQAFYSQPTEK